MVVESANAVTDIASPLRIMVVDDSSFLRGIISRYIDADPKTAVVVATAANGQLAIDRANKKDIDVIILDIEMPVMDGLTALPHLLAIDPSVVIIMASTLTTRNADISLKAMLAGAKDYVPKPSTTTPGSGAAEFGRELLEKIRILGQRFRRRPQAKIHPSRASGVAEGRSPQQRLALRPMQKIAPRALAIGSSTGGPQALQNLLKAMPAPFKLPIFITQHMPATFTAMLAQSIARETGHQCAEAKHGENVRPGRVYLAPGDFHMTVMRKGLEIVMQLNQEAKENYCRPSVDPMLRSLVQVFESQIIVSVLTGMGHDGLHGSEAVVKAGGNVFAQDEASSVVWGMPGAVARAGLCCAVEPLPQLARSIVASVGR